MASEKNERETQEVPEHRFFLRYWKVAITLVAFFALFYFTILKDLPSPTKLSTDNIPQSTQIYDRNGKLLYTIHGNKNLTYIPLSAIPKQVQHATIAIEDKDFYNHGPLDFRGIARAFISIVFHKQIQGGSTITQQLVKTSLLTPEQTITRKVKEAILAFATELLYPKDKILELYLNQIPYGGTAYGIEAAAQTYFNKHAKDLDTAEIAMLAGLPEAPTTYSPFGSHPELGKERQLEVLKAMEQQHYISSDQEKSAANEPLHYATQSQNILAPHFVMYVKDLLINEYGERMVDEGGLKVVTSLDSDIQQFAQDTVATQVAELKGYHVTNGAALVTKPSTGEILAMVGSRDYYNTQDTDGNVNITISNRQPGSSIKPVNYALGLINGYTAATPFIDNAVCFPGGDGQPQYCPMNYDGNFHGVQQLRFALGNSLNIPAVKMLKVNGVANMVNLATKMGITTYTDPSRFGLSLTLGGGEVTMTDMATVYGVFANSGYRIDLHPILKVTDKNNQVLEEYIPPTSPIFGKKVLDPAVSYIISDILADNGARLMDFGPSSALVVPGQIVSAKTGTTNDFRDNWTFGYTPSFVVAAWVGNNDNTPMNGLASGITGAAPIWHIIMSHVLEGRKPEAMQRPANIEQLAVCNPSGLLPDPAHPCQTRFEYFIKGNEPKFDTSVQKTWVDKSTQDIPPAGKTDNLEIKDEIIISDPTGDKYCATCNHPSPAPTPKP